jgi:hypothetical protein
MDHAKLKKSMDTLIQQKLVDEYLSQVLQEAIDLSRLVHVDL